MTVTTATNISAPAATADGWRMMVGEDWRPDGMRLLAVVLGDVLANRFEAARILVAHDGRRNMAGLAGDTAGLLSRQGGTVTVTGQLPSPVGSFAVRGAGFDAAVLFTASHNPANWTGIKVKLAPGTPPDREFEDEVEQRRSERTLNPTVGVTTEDASLASALSAGLRAEVIGRVDRSRIAAVGPRIVVDGLHGVGTQLLANTLAACGCSVHVVGADVCPSFAGVVPDPNLAASRMRASNAVRRIGASVGFVLDGDGDRLGVLDETGAFVWPHDILALLVSSEALRERDHAAIATTVATGSIVRRAAVSLGRELVETPVGFKHIAPLMRAGRATVGGGSVGDIGFSFHGPDRDPYLGALMITELIANASLPLGGLVSRLYDSLGRSVYREVAVPSDAMSQDALERSGYQALQYAGMTAAVTCVHHIDGVKFVIGETEGLLLRTATTEPVIRVVVEGATHTRTQALLDGLRVSWR